MGDRDMGICCERVVINQLVNTNRAYIIFCFFGGVYCSLYVVAWCCGSMLDGFHWTKIQSIKGQIKDTETGSKGNQKIVGFNQENR